MDPAGFGVQRVRLRACSAWGSSCVLPVESKRGQGLHIKESWCGQHPPQAEIIAAVRTEDPHVTSARPFLSLCLLSWPYLKPNP